MELTDDERRRVAAALRAYAETPAPWHLADVLQDVLGEKGDHDRVMLLADLIEPSCDRGALLALADEMDRDGKMQRARQKDGEHWFIDGLDVREYARRIREALGVVA